MKANGQTNSIMPIMNVLGYVPYVIVAIWGAYMPIVPVTNLGLGVRYDYFLFDTHGEFYQSYFIDCQPV